MLLSIIDDYPLCGARKTSSASTGTRPVLLPLQGTPSPRLSELNVAFGGAQQRLPHFSNWTDLIRPILKATELEPCRVHDVLGNRAGVRNGLGEADLIDSGWQQDVHGNEMLAAAFAPFWSPDGWKCQVN